MSFPILQEYETRFPECANIIQTLPTLYNKKYILLYLDSGINLLLHVYK